MTLCDAPVPGGCPRQATEVIVHRSSENLVGNGMAVWSSYFRCGGDHKADVDAKRILKLDPECELYVFSNVQAMPLEPGAYSAILNSSALAGGS